jgi:hypothetical protein
MMMDQLCLEGAKKTKRWAEIKNSLGFTKGHLVIMKTKNYLLGFLIC